MQKKMYVVFCENDGTYWCGFNKWDKQLRKAKVFHSLKYANEVHSRFNALKLKNVEIRIGLVTDNLNNADRIRSMTDEELANWLARTQYANMMEAAEIFGAQLTFNEETLKGSEKECLEWLQQPAEKSIKDD